MKTILILIGVLFTTLSQAQVLEAKPFADLAAKIANAKFTYKETGRIHGYTSTKSCLYLSDEIAIFKNYCGTGANYPARGFTIFTREWGMTKIYQEKLTDTIVTREIGIDEFPIYLVPYLQENLPDYTLDDLNGIITELYPRYNPGCWSTNFSKYSETNEAGCSGDVSNVVGFEAWAKETQDIVNDDTAWKDLLNLLETKLH